MPMLNNEQLQETESYNKKEEDIGKEVMILPPFVIVSSNC
jgi:hypothetical protein